MHWQTDMVRTNKIFMDRISIKQNSKEISEKFPLVTYKILVSDLMMLF